MSPRYVRILEALLQGPLTREQTDRVAGASNSPDAYFKLRKKYGDGLIITREAQRRDRDGRLVHIAVYELSAEGREWAAALLASNATSGEPALRSGRAPARAGTAAVHAGA